MTELHPGVTPDEVREATGWPLRVCDNPEITEMPTADELAVLRELTSQ